MMTNILIHPAIYSTCGKDVAYCVALLAGEMDDEPVSASWQYINQQLGFGRQRTRHALRKAESWGLVSQKDGVYSITLVTQGAYAALKEEMKSKDTFETGMIDNPDSGIIQ